MEKNNVIIIVAVIAGGLFVIVIVGIIIFIVVQRRRKRSRGDGAPKNVPSSQLIFGFGQSDPPNPDTPPGLNRPTNNFDRVVSNNYVRPAILNYGHRKSAAVESVNKVLPPVPAKPRMSFEANGSFRGKENSGFVNDGKVLPTVPPKPQMSRVSNGLFCGKENSGIPRDGKVLPIVPAKPQMNPVAYGLFHGKENSGFANDGKAPAKPKRSFEAVSSSRGKDNSGFMSDDSGYTTLDTTVHSADSSLYLSQKLKQDMDNQFKNSQKRIRVMDSDSMGPYAVIDILDLKNRNSRTSTSGPWPLADFQRTRNQSDAKPRKLSQTRENIYFELEKQSDISEDGTDCGDSFDVVQSRTASTVWQIGELQETDV